MAVKILHMADIHLDCAFTGSGFPPELTRKLRSNLKSTLAKIFEMARQEQVDIITICGDLYESERISADTFRFLKDEFLKLSPVKIFIAPGNHDPFTPSSIYAGLEKANLSNVHIFKEPRFVPVEISEGIYLWGFAHPSPDYRGEPLKEFKINYPAARLQGIPSGKLVLQQELPERVGFCNSDPERSEGEESQSEILRDAQDDCGVFDRKINNEGCNILLFHGSDTRAVPDGKAVHAPFTYDEVVQAGASIALTGHYHKMRCDLKNKPLLIYPGSPEPLGFDESGEHFAVVVKVEKNGESSAAPVKTNIINFSTEEIDITGISSSADGAQKIKDAAGKYGRTDIVRVILKGRIDPEISIDTGTLSDNLKGEILYLAVLDKTEPAFDYGSIAEEINVRGVFVKKIFTEMESAGEKRKEVLEQALKLGLEAFEKKEIILP
ncbi:MAG: metallophosphoesterase [Firmicutes bacterium]|nr:metallophosphoesterase [Bacillota bacterium]